MFNPLHFLYSQVDQCLILVIDQLQQHIVKIILIIYVEGKGKLIVIGSTDMFSDEYFEKEDN